MNWTIGAYDDMAVFSILYPISFLPANIWFAFPPGHWIDVSMVVPILTQIFIPEWQYLAPYFIAKPGLVFLACIPSHSPTPNFTCPCITQSLKDPFAVLYLQYINASKLTCIKIKFAGYVLHCYMATEYPTLTNRVGAVPQENRYGKTNHTLLFTVTVGIRLLKVKLLTPNVVCFVDDGRALNQLLLFDAAISPLPLLKKVLWLWVVSFRSNSTAKVGVFSSKCQIGKK